MNQSAAILVASLAAGCSGADDASSYQVATCAFGSTETSCTAIPVPDNPREWFLLAFTLVDPNPGVPPGCAGTVDLEVNTAEAGVGQVRWHAQELAPGTCADVGPPAEGSASIDGGRTLDIAFPVAGFTFRIEVNPVDQPSS